MHKPKKRYIFFVIKNHLKKKYMNILYRRDGSKNLQNKIDNLDKQQQAKLAKYISKLEKKSNLPNLSPNDLPKEEPKKNLEKKSITKIVSSMNKAYESFNVDIINNKVLQVQLH